jgi:Flp pilus assembly protein TadG
MNRWRAFLGNEAGGTAAEFALVLPLALLFLFGIIDVGRFMWDYNRAEKATQMGARYAVATDVVSSGLSSYSFAVDCAIPQGTVVNSTQFASSVCTSSQCTVTASCSGIPSGSAITAHNATAFTGIVDRMKAFKADIVAANVTVTYANSGLGFAGDPNGVDVAPLTTVQVTGLQFKPILLFNAVTLNMPAFSYSLTMEDGVGATSN